MTLTRIAKMAALFYRHVFLGEKEPPFSLAERKIVEAWVESRSGEGPLNVLFVCPSCGGRGEFPETSWVVCEGCKGIDMERAGKA